MLKSMATNQLPGILECQNLVSDCGEKQKNISRLCLKVNRGTDPSFSDMEKELLNFGVGVITSEVMLCALSLVGKHRFQYPDISHFKASPGWCYRFMARHNLSVRRRTTIAQRLPGDYEDKLLNYQRFIINQRQIHNYDVSCIGNAHQTPVTFDLPYSRTIDFKGAKSISMKTTGSEKSRFTVMLTCAGDGCKLPPYIIFRRKTLPKNINWPSGVVIRAQVKGWKDDDLTLDWANYQQYGRDRG